MNADPIREAKSETRRQVVESLAELSPHRRRAAGVAVAQRLAGLPAVREARTVMAFLSLPTEIDTWPVIRWAWNAGKRVAVPRIEPPADRAEEPIWQRRMVAVLLPLADISSIEAHPKVRPGTLGILEVPEAAPVDASAIDVVLVPCMAMDRRGRRLGKGGGFYDRFLSQPELKAPRIAIGFREQVLDEVPETDADRRVDMIVTDAETVVCR
jgi:5-formyltetrahydrofolate cyclo-ligase